MQIKEKRTALFVYLYMAGIAGIFIALVGYGICDQQTRTSAFERAGITTTATYVASRGHKGASCKASSPANCRYRYCGQVRFLVDGQTFTAEAPVSAEFHRTVEPGDTVRIRYLSDEPETVQIGPNTDPGERLLHRQMRGFHRPDNLKFLRGGVSHASFSPSPIMLF